MGDTTEVFQPLQAEDPPMVAGYRLAARLGAGGMGRVYLSHTQGGRPVAIKVVRPELADAPAFRRRFRREITAARRVRGAYTAELIDADADGVPPWLATLYVPGPSLAEAVARSGPLPLQAVLWLMAGVAEALQAIHGAGIVHRDLKPSNVLLASDGPRVIDFGISLASGVTSHTTAGSAVGTPQFMAPEQATAGELTVATDVFALGQTAAFAALGEPLYGDGPSVNVLYRIVHSKPDLSRLPEQLRPLIARCLAADPQERATPTEIVEWSRRQLGPDADAGAGPAVWREVTGPELTVPPPAPDPSPTAVHTRLLPRSAQPVGPAEPTGPDGSRTHRRGRTALITVAAVTASLLFLTGLAWTVKATANRLSHRDTTTSSTHDATASARSSASSSASTPGSASGSGTSGRTPNTASPSSTAPESPQTIVSTGLWLDATHSLSFEKPAWREDRKGDIRFDCKDAGCALDSDTSVLALSNADPGFTTLDSCRLDLGSVKSHRLTLTVAAAGSNICVKRSSGDIALLVIQVKSTAVPKLGFVSVDMTVWRAT